MGKWEIGFDAPWYLLLLLVIPLIWIWSFRSLAGLGRFRRFLALCLRSAIVTLIVFALAEIQWKQISDRMTVIYLLDQSESIPPRTRQAMADYVVKEVAKHRDPSRDDAAGVVVFGREAAVEIPPFNDNIPKLQSFESYFRTNATNLESALKTAQAIFLPDSARRCVIVTDGNENLGDARAIAKAMTDDGVGIDVVPIELSGGAEIAVERVSLPSDIRKGQPLEARVVINSFAKATDENPEGKVRGTLSVRRNDVLLSEQEVELRPGKNVFAITDKIDEPNAYTYKAQFTPTDNSQDSFVQNNLASAFTHVRGKGRVLLIENSESRGDFDYLVERLRFMNLEVTVVPSDRPFSSLADLQAYDTVVLANVPRSVGGEDGSDPVRITDEQIQMLVRNTEELGCGLVMLGGEAAFGCGGWANTDLEKIMPVDFQIKNAQVKPNGALVLMMHASELAQGNYWQKVVARESVDVLGPNDYAGVIHWSDFGSGDKWLWGGNTGLIQIGERKQMMLASIDKMTPGDMPDFEPAMKRSLNAFKALKGKASLMHMICISDGDPSPPNPATVAQFRLNNIVISTVAIGTHGPPGSTPLQALATATGGKYYVVNNPKALPTIYNKEVRRIARPLIYESKEGALQPNLDFPHEMLQGIEGPFPGVTGFVLTTVKENPLVEVALTSPKPDARENATLLASWTYKAGRTVVFTSDCGKRWTKDWSTWPSYDKFFSQMIRWSMRPVNEQGKFTIATDSKDGRVRVVVTALDNEDNFLNFLQMKSSAVAPDMTTTEISMRQEGPGRYVGEFNADQSGSYFIAVNPGRDAGAPLLTGFNVPYSAEYRDRETNRTLLLTLANLKPKGGSQGRLIEGDVTDARSLEKLTEVNTFRSDLAKAFKISDVWPLVTLIALMLFAADVFVRRVSIDPAVFAPITRFIRRALGREVVEVKRDERLERLRGRKAELSEALEDRRAANRFEPQGDTEGAPQRSLAEAMGEQGDPNASAKQQTAPSEEQPKQEGETYTDRLLKAKKKAWDERKG